MFLYLIPVSYVSEPVHPHYCNVFDKGYNSKMRWFEDVYKRRIRLTDERQAHIEFDHPEMSNQIAKVQETMSNPDIIVRSRTDPEVVMFYRHYGVTPVADKHLCVVVKSTTEDLFIITAFFTDSIKRGEVLWEKK